MSIIHIKHKCTNARLKHEDWLTDCFISAFAHSISSGGEELSYSSNPHLTWGWLWSKRKGSCALSLFIHHLWNDIYHCMHVFVIYYSFITLRWGRLHSISPLRWGRWMWWRWFWKLGWIWRFRTGWQTVSDILHCLITLLKDCREIGNLGEVILVFSFTAK